MWDLTTSCLRVLRAATAAAAVLTPVCAPAPCSAHLPFAGVVWCSQQRQRHVRFELMSDPVLAEPFAALDNERFRFSMAGTLPQYLDWLTPVFKDAAVGAKA